MKSAGSVLLEARRGLWHLRNGGLRELRIFRARQKVEAGITLFGNVAGAQGGWTGHGKKRALQFSPFTPVNREPRRNDLTVAVILDDFSALAFAYEWKTIVLRKDSWRTQLSEVDVDFLFVESAWSGNNGQWKYQLTGASRLKPEFIELMAWCRQNSIPSVFWNKEDPPHYDDFLAAAREFDVVFTSDSNKIPRYQEDLGHSRVGVLPFAAQPAVHNPVRPQFGWRERDVAFAGMYFAHKYPERREQMDILLGGAADAGRRMTIGLEIFSRQLGGDERYQFPPGLREHVVGSLSYSQVLTAYKAYKVFLNVNSVVDSPSMCARRIFEITAAGSSVVSTPSAAISSFFTTDELATVESRESAASMSRALVRSPELADRMIHKAQRKIWSTHTYAHRAESVVAAITPEREVPVRRSSISALASTIRPHQVEHIFRTIGSQIGVSCELVLLTHGFELDVAEVRVLSERYSVENFTLLSATEDISLGACLNRCAQAAGGEVVTKMDDDDYYAPHYLGDQLDALSYSAADVVGKHAHYMYLADRDATLLRFPEQEHRFTRRVMGPTLLARKTVFLEHPFEDRARGEDTAFLESVNASGGAVYSADRFNYVQNRHGGGHTWEVKETDLLASADVHFFGKPHHHVTI
ncbi:glycosyltransferase [uncultured Arthrobacter sp.]|uniref:glycosyltransferase family protein n=1 Tax=uncultured Arthrobacter sp. TaxID=114050 RepID=UPI002602612E|nr:glycosyltransferase [uncultured Arthrobacter sp.]